MMVRVSRAVALLVCVSLSACGDGSMTSASDSASGSSSGSATSASESDSNASSAGATISASDTDSGSVGETTAGPTAGTDPSTSDTGEPTSQSESDPTDATDSDPTDATATAPTDATATDPTDTTMTNGTNGTDPTDSATTDATDSATDATDTSESATTDSETGTTDDPSDSSDTDPLMCDDPGDCPQPPDCVDALCLGGSCGTIWSQIGTPCNGGLCDGGGECVECLDDGDCPDGTCENGICLEPSCDDGQQNGTETDVDCGGDCPEKCADGEGCNEGSDCQSNSCQDNICGPEGLACLNEPPNPITGQGCPIFSECSEFSDCGEFKDCQQWYCDSGICALNTLSNCWDTVGGQCVAGVVLTQHVDPPVDKDFLAPDGIDFRELGSLTITVQNNTSDDLYLDKIPLHLDTMGGSNFDVDGLKLYQDFGGSDFETPGDFFFCITGDPFQFPANGVLGPCGGSSFSRVVKNGGTRRFVITLAFEKEKTYIAGRSYRLRLDANAVLEFRVGGTFGPAYTGTQCGVPNSDFVGAWVHAK